MTRAELESEILDWMRERPWRPDAARFERLALSLYEIQFAGCEPYALLCRSLGRTPGTVTALEEIPVVPTGAFKEFDLRCFDESDTLLTFRTSGTSVERRGRLSLDRLDLYETSLLASLRETFLTGLVGKRPTMRFLAPSPAEAADSSLTHMFETLRREEGSDDCAYDLREGKIDFRALHAAIENERARERAMIIAGTSFAFVHFLDALQAESSPPRGADWRLPPGSRVIETGGFKGRSREVPRDVLRAGIADCFGIPETSVVNQYGMTELGSQFYDSTLVDPAAPRHKIAPPWARVRIVDPDSGRDIRDGEVGQIVIHDLANTGSVAAIQTADLGRAVVGEQGVVIGFDVLGREAGAEARGCSIAADVMIDASHGGASR